MKIKIKRSGQLIKEAMAPEDAAAALKGMQQELFQSIGTLGQLKPDEAQLIADAIEQIKAARGV
jgi:hypothetical protein